MVTMIIHTIFRTFCGTSVPDLISAAVIGCAKYSAAKALCRNPAVVTVTRIAVIKCAGCSVNFIKICAR